MYEHQREAVEAAWLPRWSLGLPLDPLTWQAKLDLEGDFLPLQRPQGWLAGGGVEFTPEEGGGPVACHLRAGALSEHAGGAILHTGGGRRACGLLSACWGAF